MSKYQLVDIVSLLKVFDENYLSDEDYMAISDIDINDRAAQELAINLLVVPEFSSWGLVSQERLKSTLRYYLNEENSDFRSVFERISFPFEDEIGDQRGFIESIWNCLFTSESFTV